MSAEERRALVVIAALLVIAAGARWVERPRPLLDDVAALDLDELERASEEAKPAPAVVMAPGRKLDPNRASAAELMALPGVGPALAARIIEERDRAPFSSVSDMARVRGIGPAMTERIAPLISLPAQSTAIARTASAGRGGASTPGSTVETRAGSRSATAESGGPIDLNRASAAELEQVRGIGPVLAARLIAYRDSVGRFASWDAVDSINGVGPSMLARLKGVAVLRQSP